MIVPLSQPVPGPVPLRFVGKLAGSPLGSAHSRTTTVGAFEPSKVPAGRLTSTYPPSSREHGFALAPAHDAATGLD